MDTNLSSRILIAISMLYGITVGILGYLGSSAVSVVAFVGAMAIGALWALRSLFGKAPSTQDKA